MPCCCYCWVLSIVGLHEKIMSGLMLSLICLCCGASEEQVEEMAYCTTLITVYYASRYNAWGHSTQNMRRVMLLIRPHDVLSPILSLKLLWIQSCVEQPGFTSRNETITTLAAHLENSWWNWWKLLLHFFLYWVWSDHKRRKNACTTNIMWTHGMTSWDESICSYFICFKGFSSLIPKSLEKKEKSAEHQTPKLCSYLKIFKSTSADFSIDLLSSPQTLVHWLLCTQQC